LITCHVLVVRQSDGRRNRFGSWQRLPASVAYPGALFHRGILDYVESCVLAILLEQVLHLAFESQRLGMRHVDAAILQLLAVKDGYRNDAARLRMLLVAGPLQHRDGAKLL